MAPRRPSVMKKIKDKVAKTSRDISRHVAPYRLRQDPRQTVPFQAGTSSERRCFDGDKPMDHIYREAMIFLGKDAKSWTPVSINAVKAAWRKVVPENDTSLSPAERKALYTEASKQCHNVVKLNEKKQGFVRSFPLCLIDGELDVTSEAVNFPRNYQNQPLQGIVVRWYVALLSNSDLPIKAAPLTKDTICAGHIQEDPNLRFSDDVIPGLTNIGYTKLNFEMGTSSKDENFEYFQYHKIDRHGTEEDDTGLAQYVITRDRIRKSDATRTAMYKELKQYSKDYYKIKSFCQLDEPYYNQPRFDDDVVSASSSISMDCSSDEEEEDNEPVSAQKKIEQLSAYIMNHPSLKSNPLMLWVSDMILNSEANRDKFYAATFNGLTFRDWPRWAFYNFDQSLSNKNLSNQKAKCITEVMALRLLLEGKNIDPTKQYIGYGLDEIHEYKSNAGQWTRVE